MGSDAMDGESDSNGLYFLLMIYRGCCLSHGKGGNYYSHAETQRAQSFIRTRIERIERIDSIFGVHERCLQRCTDH